ncbi:hypothetical protein [Streptomyces sp. NPDC002044]|uniref:hypothetical protein n=1 Tax=Streptomyces sp. NPDC002044 TaxID=3154662 RepID=UPI00331EAD87
MTRAEPAWRQALAAQDLDGIRRQAEAQAKELHATRGTELPAQTLIGVAAVAVGALTS